MISPAKLSLDYAAAVVHTLQQEMASDPRIFVYGEGINDPGAYLNSTDGLASTFGQARCFDVPNCEDALVGLGIGSALMGYRPVFVSLRVDFLMLAMNQIINHAARWPAMTGYQVSVPLTIRALIGRGWGQAAQHSGALYSMFANVPGLEVVLPSSPAEVAGLLLTAMRSDKTTIVIDDRGVFGAAEDIPAVVEPIPFGKAHVARAGTDLTFFAISSMTQFALEVADQVSASGISAEVVDLRTARPLDEETIRASAARTGRVAVFDIGWAGFGLSAEVARVVMEASGLQRPLLSVHRRDEHTPSSAFLEDEHYPKLDEVVRRVKAHFT
jgi:acetoin:2,6-dichlorophenolindophenol oxidoreductase subunit beta